jgi:hypothetical protein
MTREIERRVLLNMINEHIEKNKITSTLYSYDEVYKEVSDLQLILRGIQGCLDAYVKAFNDYIEGK